MKRHGHIWQKALGAACVLAPTLTVSLPAYAQTSGSNGFYNGNAILAEILGTGGLIQPNSTTGTDLVDLTTTAYGYIKNPYMAVVVGVSGSFGVNHPAGGTNTVTATHNVGGMLTFGNIKGSSRFATDDFQSLCGFEYPFGPYEYYLGTGRPFGYGVWPLPGWWEITNGGAIEHEFSSYTRIQVDTTVTNVMGSNGTLLEPQFNIYKKNELRTLYDVGSNVQVTQEIRLFHAMSQIRWHIVNRDTAPHTVRLRFTTNVRPNSLGVTGFNERTGFFFNDGTGNTSEDARILTDTSIPDQLTVYGKRYETDSTTDPPFAARHILRKFGATAPDKVVIAHPFELRPNGGGFNFNSVADFTRPKMTEGIATAIYFNSAGGDTIPAGGSRDYVTYYGNGSPDDLPNDDFTVGVDGPEALAYNANAANDPTILGNVGANPADAIPKFLSPNPLTIYGTVYNQVSSTPDTAVNFNNVRLSLTLPTGLAFGINPTTQVTDVAEKPIGTLQSDSGKDATWTVKPTGQAYGTMAYVLNVSSSELSARQITRTINVPATPFRAVTPQSFQMIGFPFEFDPVNSNNGDPATVVNGLSSPKDDPVFFYSYVPDPQDPSGFGRYVVVNKLENGIGYMYRPNLSRTIFAKGVRPYTGQANVGLTDFTTNNQRQLTLEKGWNIISNPYLYEIPLNSLRFALPTQDGDISSVPSQTFSSAVSSGLVRGSIFFIDTARNSYDYIDDASKSIKPWEGYWIYVANRVVLIYALPTQRQSAILPGGPDPAPITRGVIASGKALVTNPSLEDWRLQLVAHQGTTKADAATIIGVNTDSRVKETQRTMPKPPVAVSDYVYVGIVKSGVANTRFAKDVRATNGTNEWTMDVTSDKSGPVTLTWPNIATLPRRINLTVKDTTSGRVYAMRSSSSLTLNVTPGKPTRLVVTAKQQSAQPLLVSDLMVTSTRSTGGRSFSFNLSREASVTGRIKTLSGNTIATLAVSRAAAAGINRLPWNGRAQNGNPIPPGPYLIDITAQGADGESTTVSRNFMTLE